MEQVARSEANARARGQVLGEEAAAQRTAGAHNILPRNAGLDCASALPTQRTM